MGDIRFLGFYDSKNSQSQIAAMRYDVYFAALQSQSMVGGVVTAPNMIMPQTYPPPGAVMAANQPGVVTGKIVKLVVP